MLSFYFILILAFIAYLTFRKTKNVNGEEDFLLSGRNLNYKGVSSVIIATIVGGVSTIGSVQMAYKYGLAAWIYTLGAGVGCLILAVFFAKPLRERNVTTVSEYIGKTFGEKARIYSSSLSSVGIFIQVIAQLLAASAIIDTIFTINPILSLAISSSLVFIFSALGGIKGSDFIGRIKLYMTYSIMFIAAVLAVYKGGGANNIISKLPTDIHFGSLFSYGISKGSIDIISTIIGVISTQTYLQGIFAAKNYKEAKKGLYLSAVLIPLIGLLSVPVGLYLRSFHPEIAANSSRALPIFINEYLPAPIAALFMAGLLVIVLGTASGLVLGAATNLYVDVIRQFSLFKAINNDLTKVRIVVVGVLVLGAIFSIFVAKATILNLTFLSMGLRGVSVLPALIAISALKTASKSKTLKLAIFVIPSLYIIFSAIYLFF